MGWFKNLFASDPLDESPVRIGGNPLETDGDRLDRHIHRFTLALEQCEKPERKPELRAWLDYYSNLKSAQRRLEGVIG